MATNLPALLRSNTRILAASRNSPPIRQGEPKSVAVALLQEAFVLLGHPMPNSTLGPLQMDGIFGGETKSTVQQFQSRNSLLPDGIVGRNTLDRLFTRIQEAFERALNFARVIQSTPSLAAGATELGVSWTSNPERMKEYFRLSAILQFGDAQLEHERKNLVTSWCSFFVHFALFKGGAKAVPRKANLNVGDSISRFVDTYITPLGKKPADFVPGKYEPQPGDMYNLPRSPFSNPPGALVNHIGLVIGRERLGDPSSPIRTLDGNSVSPSTMALLRRGLGGGLVVVNSRDEGGAFPIAHYFPQTLAFPP